MYRSRSFNLMMFPQHEILFLLSRPALVPARYSDSFHIHPMEFKNSRFAPKCAPKC